MKTIKKLAARIFHAIQKILVPLSLFFAYFAGLGIMRLFLLMFPSTVKVSPGNTDSYWKPFTGCSGDVRDAKEQS
ncbi:MAG: hypothetical protein ABIG11_06640 [bacterium]